MASQKTKKKETEVERAEEESEFICRGASEDQFSEESEFQEFQEFHKTLPLPNAIAAENTWRTWYPVDQLSNHLQKILDRPRVRQPRLNSARIGSR